MIKRWSAQRLPAGAALLIALTIVAAATPAEDVPATNADRSGRAARLAEMHGQAALFQIASAVKADRQRFELFGDPIFRYSDQPRGFVDATVWAWGGPERRGRPVAVAKIEMALSEIKLPYWQYCVASLADTPLDVDFANERKLTAARPGLALRDFPDAPPPAAGAAARQRQMKDLAARFGATIHALQLGTKELLKQEMRLLPSPIHRYSDDQAGLIDGMLFGLTTNGTNPDVLIVIESRREKDADAAWHFGFVKMTYAEVHLRIDREEVWSSSTSEPLETWTYFQQKRNE
jgi:hypothetical protein